jgi:DNA-binding PadR family transcriptional regulator
MQSPNTFVKGQLETIVLQLLNDGSRMYGYEITQKVRELSDEQIVLTEGALYPVLHKLEGQGLLQTDQALVKGRIRIYYRLTAQGNQAAVDRLQQLHDQLAVFLKVLAPPTKLA